MIPYYDYDSPKPTEESPYRIIEVEPDMVLYDFALYILDCFDFDNDHPFGFYDNTKRFHSSKKGFVMRFEDEDEWLTFDPDNIFGDLEKSCVSDMLTRKGKKWLLLFDYGDEWNFWITLEDKLVKQPKISYPRITESYLEPPSQYEYDDED